MKFLLKSPDIKEDCEFALLQAQRELKWKSPDVEFIIKYADLEYPDINKDFSYCPVGSVEFCQANFPKYCKPRNIPDELDNFIGSRRFTDEDFLKLHVEDKSYKVFIKSKDIIKHPANGFYDLSSKTYGEILKKFGVASFDDLQVIQDIEEHQRALSTRHDTGILSEWRVFVFNNEVLDVRRYAGDYAITPHVDSIEAMVKELKYDAPPAYVLDVFMSDLNGIRWTNCMEMHDFFACGLYGFDKILAYPYMCNQWFAWWKRQCRR